MNKDMNDREYWEQQIKGLILILSDGLNCEKPIYEIHRSYVIEKLNMIRNGGIGFHPVIINKLEGSEE